MTMPRRAFTFIEILIACVVITLATVPMLGILSASNRTSKASIFEVMAVQHAAELAEQLLRLSPHLKALRNQTGRTIKDLLEASSVQALLRPSATPANRPTLLPLFGTDVVLYCSPLDPNFTARIIRVTALDTSGNEVLKTGAFWKVTIGLAWKKSAGDGPTHNASFSLVLREAP